MKKEILILFYFSIYSISLIGQSEVRVSNFENILGKENVKTLNYLVEDFENDYLPRKYPNLEIQDAYEKYLAEIVNSDYGYSNTTSEIAKQVFKESQLRLDLYYVPDSIWIEGNQIKQKVSYKHKDSIYYRIDERPIFKSRMHLSNDSIIKHKLENLYEFRLFGRFMNALLSVKTDDYFIEGYYSDKEIAGYISHYIVANQMLKLNLEFSDYFYKRIVILEFAY